MRFDFQLPSGWTAAKLPSDGRGLVLQAPGPVGARDRAALFLLDPLVKKGSLAEQFEAAVQTSLSTVDVEKRGAVQPLSSAAYPGLLMPVRVRVTKPDSATTTEGHATTQVEGRLYFLLDAPTARLLIVFVGGPDALPRHQPVLDAFLRSIRPTDEDVDSVIASSPYSTWGD